MDAETLATQLHAVLHASGYSQQEVARALGLHPGVLSRKLHGRGHAQMTQREVRHLLTTLASWQAIKTRDEACHLLALAHLPPSILTAEEWQTPPLSQLEGTHLPPSPASGGSLLPPSHPPLLPTPTTRLIGRDWAVARLLRLLGQEDVRLVTLIGPGGSGKTRLALQVAKELVGAFAQGVCWVDLATVSDPALVPLRLFEAFGRFPAQGGGGRQGLLNALGGQHLLLVLDQCEHLVEAIAVVGELLAGASCLKVLATSQVALQLSGEHLLSVPPLDIPGPTDAVDPDTLEQYGAIQLLVERVQAVVPDFRVTAENATALAQICARLDGLPLALELVAARFTVFSPAHLLEHLCRERLPLLTGGARNAPRTQQSLRQTCAWSYRLLSPAEQGCWRRLGVFTGSWSLEAAQALLAGVAPLAEPRGSPASEPPASCAELIEHLVAHSLVLRLPLAGEQVRFRLLETLRDYALELLTVQGELEQVQAWQAAQNHSGAAPAQEERYPLEPLQRPMEGEAEQEPRRVAPVWAGARGHTSTSPDSGAVPSVACRSESRDAHSPERTSEVGLRWVGALAPSWEWLDVLPAGDLGSEAELPLP